MSQITFIQLAVLSVACWAAIVSASCYIEYGCNDPLRNNREYEEGQRWKPKANLCASCECYASKKYVVGCRIAVEQAPARIFNVKKSSLSAQLEEESREEKEQYEEIEIPEEEAANKKCDPVRAPAYNWLTGQFEQLTYKIEYYYYMQKKAHCCTRYTSYVSVHPSCKVIKLGKCKQRVVQRANPKKRCYMPMSAVF